MGKVTPGHFLSRVVALHPSIDGIPALISRGQVSGLSGKLAVEQREGALTPLQATWKGQYHLTLSGKNHNDSKPD